MNVLSAQNDSLNNIQIMKINSGLNNILRSYQLLIEEHLSNIDPELLADEAIKGMTNSLDDYTEYLNESESNPYMKLLRKNFIGIGINTEKQEDKIYINYLLDKSPAQLSGMKVGDRILKIDDSIVDVNEDLNSKLQGEIGTKVKITIIRGFKKLDTLDFIIDRAKISDKGITFYSLINDSIGYIQLKNFTTNTRNDIISTYNEFKIQSNYNLKGIILDLRNNGGGLMKSAYDVFELFVPVGKYFGKMINKYNQKIEIFTKKQPIDTNISIALIVNNNTASAGEFLTVALQDYNRAKVIGYYTTGKGISQILRDISSHKSLKITTERFISPKGRDINIINYNPKFSSEKSIAIDSQQSNSMNARKGIIPDIIVQDSSYSPLILELLKRNVFNDFANDYIYFNIDKIPTESDNNLFRNFRYFAIDSFRNLNIISNSELEEFKKTYNNQVISSKIDELIDNINNYFINSFDNEKKDIIKILNYEILLRHKSNVEVEEFILKDDSFLIATLKTFGIYNKSFYFSKKS